MIDWVSGYLFDSGCVEGWRRSASRIGSKSFDIDMSQSPFGNLRARLLMLDG